MDQESMKKLRLDRRLLRRRGWVDQEQVDAALAALPDSVDKVARPQDEPETAEAESAANSPSPATRVPGSPEGGGS